MNDDLPYVRLTPEQRAYLNTVDNNIHWTRGNVIVMFQGKCANTAIKAAILQAEGGINPEINVHGDPRLNYVNRDYVIRYRNTVPVVAVVRKPWDRLVSFWRDKIAGRDESTFTCNYLPGAYGNMPFPEFVPLVMRALDEATEPSFLVNHLAPAYSHLTAYGVSLPHECIKFEDLVAGPGWKRLRHWTACAWELPETLPHMNRPKVPKPELSREEEFHLRVAVYGRYYLDYKQHGWHA
jgi:hypothetical protein